MSEPTRDASLARRRSRIMASLLVERMSRSAPKSAPARSSAQVPCHATAGIHSRGTVRRRASSRWTQSLPKSSAFDHVPSPDPRRSCGRVPRGVTRGTAGRAAPNRGARAPRRGGPCQRRGPRLPNGQFGTRMPVGRARSCSIRDVLPSESPARGSRRPRSHADAVDPTGAGALGEGPKPGAQAVAMRMGPSRSLVDERDGGISPPV